MDDYGAFRVISGIDADLYILRGISQLVSAMYTALEKDENEPETFYPGIYAIHQIMWKLTARSTLTTWQLPRPRRRQITV